MVPDILQLARVAQAVSRLRPTRPEPPALPMSIPQPEEPVVVPPISANLFPAPKAVAPDYRPQILQSLLGLRQPLPTWMFPQHPSFQSDPYGEAMRGVARQLTTAERTLKALPEHAEVKPAMNRETAIGLTLLGLLGGAPAASLLGGFMQSAAEKAREEQALRQQTLLARRRELQEQIMQAAQQLGQLGGFRARGMEEREMESQRLAQERARILADLEQRRIDQEMQRVRDRWSQMKDVFNMTLLGEQYRDQKAAAVREAMEPFLNIAMKSGNVDTVSAAIGHYASALEANGVRVPATALLGAVNTVVKENRTQERIKENLLQEGVLKLKALEREERVGAATEAAEIEQRKLAPEETKARIAHAYASARAAGRSGGGGGAGSSLALERFKWDIQKYYESKDTEFRQQILQGALDDLKELESRKAELQKEERTAKLSSAQTKALRNSISQLDMQIANAKRRVMTLNPAYGYSRWGQKIPPFYSMEMGATKKSLETYADMLINAVGPQKAWEVFTKGARFDGVDVSGYVPYFRNRAKEMNVPFLPYGTGSSGARILDIEPILAPRKGK